MYAFEHVKPVTLDEALAHLKDEGAQALAGGQTLIPTLRARLAMPEKLVEVSRLAALRGVEIQGDELIIGAATTHADVAEAPEVRAVLPGLGRLADGIGDPQVRNRGTIGGSLANNDPAACYPAAVLALDAIIVTDRRELEAPDFFQGLFATALEEGELILRVRFPIPKAAAYAKAPQPASRFAMAGVFVARFENGVRVGVTGAGDDGVFLWREAADALSADFSPEALEGAALDETAMLSDIHADQDYRANLVRVMAKRAVKAAR